MREGQRKEMGEVEGEGEGEVVARSDGRMKYLLTFFTGGT